MTLTTKQKKKIMLAINLIGKGAIPSKRKHLITVIVEGGLVQDVCNVPKDYRVKVIDYDVDTTDRVDHDNNGRACFISEW